MRWLENINRDKHRDCFENGYLGQMWFRQPCLFVGLDLGFLRCQIHNALGFGYITIWTLPKLLIEAIQDYVDLYINRSLVHAWVPGSGVRFVRGGNPTITLRRISQTYTFPSDFLSQIL